MHVEEAIRSRYSTRGFLPNPVSKESLAHILEVAARAPSGNNTQPWKVYVIQGPAKDALTEAALRARESDQRPEREYASNPRPLPEPYKSRSRQNGIALYTALGIGRHDNSSQNAQQRLNYHFFGAPVGMFFFIDRHMETGNWLDYGMFIQNVMLAARGVGLHTCPQGAWTNFHPTVREHLGAPASEMLVCGMSIGYEDPNHLANRLKVPRESLESFSRWVGF